MTKLDELFSDINKKYKEQVATVGKVRAKSSVIPYLA